MNSTLHDFAVEALKINKFLEQYLTSPSLRLSYTLGILGGEHPPGIEEQAHTTRAKRQDNAAIARAAKAKQRKEWAAKQKPVTSDMAPARVRYDDWANEVPVGMMRNSDMIILVMGKDLFTSKRGARVIVGNILRNDPRWQQQKTRSGYSRKDAGGACVWMRMPPDKGDTAMSHAMQLAQKVRTQATARKRKQRSRALVVERGA